MTWETLKVYKPLSKDKLVVAKKEINKIVEENLKPYGFKLYGRKLLKLSEDLFYIIHLDTRGSWMGFSNSLKTDISIVSVFDTNIFIEGHEYLPKQYIQDLIPDIKNYYQITSEYILFANYLSRKLEDYIIPYFNKYKNSEDIIKYSDDFDSSNLNLHLYSKLKNHDNSSINTITKKIEFLNRLKSNPTDISELLQLKENLERSNWEEIDNILQNHKEQVLKKLKI